MISDGENGEKSEDGEIWHHFDWSNDVMVWMMMTRMPTFSFSPFFTDLQRKNVSGDYRENGWPRHKLTPVMILVWNTLCIWKPKKCLTFFCYSSVYFTFTYLTSSFFRKKLHFNFYSFMYLHLCVSKWMRTQKYGCNAVRLNIYWMLLRKQQGDIMNNATYFLCPWHCNTIDGVACVCVHNIFWSPMFVVCRGINDI